MSDTFEIFCSVAPGLEAPLLQEVVAAGFADPEALAGGVRFQGGWPEVWRANLVLRGAARVLARIGGFPAFHLAQLDKRARRFDWGALLRPEVPVRVEVTTNRKSKIYHAGAAQQRIETALVESHGMQVSAEAALVLKVRIDDNFVQFSLDTSGESLHRRGTKEAVGKAPMRETLAALFLRQCGYDGTEPVVDPMCGSGTFLLEAAGIALNRAPGAARGFAFEQLASFDPAAWEAMRTSPRAAPAEVPYFLGRDRDQGAIQAAGRNVTAAGLEAHVGLACQPISALDRPEGAPGLVIVNPPYGARIGNKKQLFALYGSLGAVLKERFAGWRVGIITSEPGLAKATALPFLPALPPVAHGGLRIALHRTGPLG